EFPDRRLHRREVEHARALFWGRFAAPRGAGLIIITFLRPCPNLPSPGALMRRRFLPEKIVAVIVLVGALTAALCLVEANYLASTPTTGHPFGWLSDAVTGARNRIENFFQPQTPTVILVVEHCCMWANEADEEKVKADAEDLRPGLVATY